MFTRFIVRDAVLGGISANETSESKSKQMLITSPKYKAGVSVQVISQNRSLMYPLMIMGSHVNP